MESAGIVIRLSAHDSVGVSDSAAVMTGGSPPTLEERVATLEGRLADVPRQLKEVERRAREHAELARSSSPASALRII